MIRLTRINRVPLVLNSDLIEHIETTADTVITLSTGQKLRVVESAEEIVNRVVEFRRCVNSTAGFEAPGFPVADRLAVEAHGCEETN